MSGGAHRTRRGFSLLEILVALFVLAIGLLGCLILQSRALQGSHAAYQSSLASVFAADFAERLWLDRAQDGGGAAWLATWREQRDCANPSGHVCLPDLAIDYAPGATLQRLALSWAETRFAGAPEGRSEFVYHFLLPVGGEP